MTRRADPKKPARPFYRFPWTAGAINEAVSLAMAHDRDDRAPRASYRQIADHLWANNLVPQKPDPATVARMLIPELAKRRALAELAKGAA